MDRLEEIRKRLNKATQGPWLHNGKGEISSLPSGKQFSDDLLIADDDGCSPRFCENVDADFVAHAPDDIKCLLEQITALQEENNQLKSEPATLTKALEMAVPSENDRKCYIRQARSANSKEGEK